MAQATETMMAAHIRGLQANWKTSPDPDTPAENWWATLDMESAVLRAGVLVCVFRDQFGQRFGWRWTYAGGAARHADWKTMLLADLSDDLITGGWTAPDVDGVRWLIGAAEAQPAAV